MTVRKRIGRGSAALRAASTAVLLALSAQAAPADIPEVVEAWRDGNVIHVTLAHPDEGWEHYADGWEVLGPDGTRLGLRVLTHPHVAEQPFTRSLKLESLPAGPLSVRARCSRDGWGSVAVPVREN